MLRTTVQGTLSHCVDAATRMQSTFGGKSPIFRAAVLIQKSFEMHPLPHQVLMYKLEVVDVYIQKSNPFCKAHRRKHDSKMGFGWMPEKSVSGREETKL